MLRLNLGGGDTHIEGYSNVDLCPNSDIHHNLLEPLPFEDGSVDEILAIHVIESFYAWEFPTVIKDWHRVLKKGSQMTIEFTVLSESIKLYQSDNPADKQHGKWGLYGNQEQPSDPIVLHHYVYEVDELKKILEQTGFSVEFSGENIVHWAGRDMRAICIA